ncbi:MAG: hypothetical protein R3B06_28310 [Kofleriaceae bacterium]
MVRPVPAIILGVAALAARGRAEPLPTHVTPWAPTGGVVEPGRVRLEYGLVAHVSAAAGVAPGLELRVAAGAPIAPLQLFAAEVALRGQLVRAGPLRVTVGAQAAAAWLDGATGRRHGGELTVGLHGPRGHVAWSRRRYLGGAAPVEVDVATASIDLGPVRAAAAVGWVPAPSTGCPRAPRARGDLRCLATTAPAPAHALALGVQFHGGRVTGSAGLALVLRRELPPVPLPYLVVSVPLRP